MRKVTLLLLMFSFVGTYLPGENWPQWRGPDGIGVSLEKDLPWRWGSEENVLWRADLKGLGVSSPIVWEDKVFVTAQLGKTAIRPGDLPSLSRGTDATEYSIGGAQDNASGQGSDIVFLVQAFQVSDGALAWEYSFPGEGPYPETHDKHNQATPSCVTDGGSVYCWFGSGPLVALTLDGQLVWKRSLGKDYGGYNIDYGHGSSPVLYRDSIILLSDNSPNAYLLALDTMTGQEKWKAVREGARRSFSTPLLIQVRGREELIVNSSEAIDAYDPASGTVLWSYNEPVKWPVPSPAFGNGVIFTSRGSRSGPYMAIRPGGTGVVLESDVLRWRVPTGAPYVSSLVYWDGVVYMIGDRGIVTATDAETGKTLWKSRVGGIFSASPVVADGKIYLTSEGGEVTVLRADRGGAEVLARSPLGGRVIASPAIANGRLYFRTDQQLVSIGR